MIKITNGRDIFEVSSGAFEGIYKRQGFRPVKEATSAVEEEIKVPEKTEDEIFLEEIAEKPIASWNKNDVKKFAELKGIDITGTKNADEAKERIKAFIDSQEQE